MDANQTRFHLVLGADDWSRARPADGTPADATWVDAAGRLALRPRPPEATPAMSAAEPPPRTSAARDRDGNFYRVAGPMILLDRGKGTTETFWPGDLTVDALPPDLTGLAITGDDVLATGAPDGAWLFDLLAGGRPRHLALPVRPEFLAATQQDLLVLGDDALWRVRITPPAPRRVCAADPAPGSFRPCGEIDGWGYAISGPVALPDGTSPRALTAHGGRAVILDAGTHLLIEDAGTFSRLPIALPGDPPATLIDLASAGELLFGVDAHGTAAWALDAAGAVRPDAWPMRLADATALVAADGRGWYHVSDGTDDPERNRWIELHALPRAAFPYAGARVLPGPDGDEAGFDSGVPGCVWHRVTLDACVPAGTRLTVRARAADTRAELSRGRWTAWGPALRGAVPEDLLVPIRRGDGSEVPHQRPTHPGEATWEVLLPVSTGRYLEIELGLESQGRRTPTVTALRAYGPRFSWLDAYLPAAFRDDPVSASFLARFLANLEGVLTATEDRIAAIQVLFHPDATHPEFLPWLAGWFDATLNPEWSEARRRFFLRNAMVFFHWRGTARGIRLAARTALAADDALCDALLDDGPGPVRIIEPFTTRPAPRAAAAATAGLAALDPSAPWAETEGPPGLFARWALTPAGAAAPNLLPLTGADAATFFERVAGFTPSAAPDADRWRAYLRRRHRAPSALSAAWGRTYATFDEVPAPTHLGASATLPATAGALRDWLDWQRVVAPIRATAHRFTVVLQRPPEADLRRDPDLLRRSKDAVARVVHAEKPAHTVFEITWDDLLFRPGDARLGRDSVVAPEVEIGGALELGAATLGEAWVVAEFPLLPRDPATGAWLPVEDVPPEST